MKFDMCIKSGTCGHYDYDNCDLKIETIEVSTIPNVGDTIIISLKEKYHVTEIVRSYVKDKSYVDEPWMEYITVYVIKK